MLINTVLVFLQNILPIFVVFSLLFAQQNTRHQEHNSTGSLSFIELVKTTLVGLIIVGLLSHYMPGLSQLFDGTGLEIVFSILFSLIYYFIAASFLFNQYSRHKKCQHQLLIRLQSYISHTTLLLVLCVHGSYFSLYVMSLTISNVAIDTLYSGIVIGVIIGTGICISIAILLYFILTTIDKKSQGKVTYYFLLFFGVGQLMQGLQLLEQVDIISSNVHLWSTNYLIAEDSELGYFLTILFGYEATPSAMELIVYLGAIIVPILIAKIISYKQNYTASLMEGTF